MTNSTHSDDRLSWTALGVRMGFTREQPQRDEILAAIDHMSWTQTPARVPYLEGPAVRAIVNAVFHHRRDQLRLVGVAQLNGGRQLIGLEDSLGTRSYVLDMDSEAIYVLAEFPHPLAAPNVEQWSPEAGPVEGQYNLLDEIDCDTYRACSENRSWAAWPTGHTTPTSADDTVARRVSQLARQSRALLELASAYHGNTYRLLRDLGDHLGVSLAYVDRATINAHLDRTLSDLEWAAINDQFTALDFDDHIADQGRFRTEWIETVLDKAGAPGYGYTTDAQPAGDPEPVA